MLQYMRTLRVKSRSLQQTLNTPCTKCIWLETFKNKQRKATRKSSLTKDLIIIVYKVFCLVKLEKRGTKMQQQSSLGLPWTPCCEKPWLACSAARFSIFLLFFKDSGAGNCPWIPSILNWLQVADECVSRWRERVKLADDAAIAWHFVDPDSKRFTTDLCRPRNAGPNFVKMLYDIF